MDDKAIPEDKNNPFKEYLASAAYAIRASFHASHGQSPAKLVFGRDMFMPVSRNINWDAIKERKQKAICTSNERENKKRINHTYKYGDWITIKKTGILCKLEVLRLGPYKVIKHHSNGTITYEKAPFNNKKVNIQRAHPYYWENEPPE